MASKILLVGGIFAGLVIAFIFFRGGITGVIIVGPVEELAIINPSFETENMTATKIADGWTEYEEGNPEWVLQYDVNDDWVTDGETSQQINLPFQIKFFTTGEIVGLKQTLNIPENATFMKIDYRHQQGGIGTQYWGKVIILGDDKFSFGRTNDKVIEDTLVIDLSNYKDKEVDLILGWEVINGCYCNSGFLRPFYVDNIIIEEEI